MKRRQTIVLTDDAPLLLLYENGLAFWVNFGYLGKLWVIFGEFGESLGKFCAIGASDYLPSWRATHRQCDSCATKEDVSKWPDDY